MNKEKKRLIIISILILFVVIFLVSGYFYIYGDKKGVGLGNFILEKFGFDRSKTFVDIENDSVDTITLNHSKNIISIEEDNEENLNNQEIFDKSLIDEVTPEEVIINGEGIKKFEKFDTPISDVSINNSLPNLSSFTNFAKTY